MEESSSSNAESFSIEELFPDLSQVDPEVFEMLPITMQRQVRQAMADNLKEHPINNTELVVCDKCEKRFLKEEMDEHNDYHLAVDLQNEISSQPSTSTLKSTSTTTAKPTKRPMKESKKKVSKEKRSRTIDTFFGRNT